MLVISLSIMTLKPPCTIRYVLSGVVYPTISGQKVMTKQIPNIYICIYIYICYMIISYVYNTYIYYMCSKM